MDAAQVTAGGGGEAVDDGKRCRRQVHVVARKVAADVEREIG